MTNEELRDGLAKVLACCEWDNVGEREISVMRPVADAALAYIDSQHADCKCDLRTRLVGDGCEICNPAKALEYAKETISELRAGHAEFVRAARADIKRAFRLGELHWQQADSESWSQNKKARDTAAKFDELLTKYDELAKEN